MVTKLNDYIEEVRSGYDEDQRAHLDGEMRRFDLAGQMLALRLAADMTQAELAKRAGLSQADISRYERGLGNPTRTTIEGIATVLGAHLELVRDARQTPEPEPA